MGWKTPLMISAIIVVIIGFAIYFGIIYWTKKYTKKYVEKAQREAIEQIRTMRNDIGSLPFELENYFKSKVNPYDIEGMINTIYLNKYQDKLILSKNEEFAFASISMKTQGKTFYHLKDFDFEKYNSARMEKPELFPNDIELYSNQKIDFIGVFNSNFSLEEIFESFFDKLNENGMICVSLNKVSRKDVNNLLETLKYRKINHEISYFSTRFLFITNKKS